MYHQIRTNKLPRGKFSGILTLENKFIRFCVVGLVCALIDWGTYFLIIKICGQPNQEFKQFAKILSFIISASSSYLLNRFWTFKSDEKRIFRQAFKFLLVAFVGLGLNSFFFYLSTSLFHWSDLIGLVVATGLTLFWNFNANKILVFRNNPKTTNPETLDD